MNFGVNGTEGTKIGRDLYFGIAISNRTRCVEGYKWRGLDVACIKVKN